MLKTHFAHIQQLSEAESKRIDAIRAVDVAAVAIASEKAAAQAAVLANQVSTSEEALRNLVQQITNQLTERLALLEKAQYESQGKSGASPDLSTMVADLIAAQNVDKGKSGISNQLMMLIVGSAIGFAFYIIQLVLK